MKHASGALKCYEPQPVLKCRKWPNGDPPPKKQVKWYYPDILDWYQWKGCIKNGNKQAPILRAFPPYCCVYSLFSCTKKNIMVTQSPPSANSRTHTQIINFRVERPSLLCTKMDHPKMGLIRSAFVPFGTSYACSFGALSSKPCACYSRSRDSGMQVSSDTLCVFQDSVRHILSRNTLYNFRTVWATRSCWFFEALPLRNCNFKTMCTHEPRRRIYPKDIVINIGEGEPIPEHLYPGMDWKEVSSSAGMG